MATNLGSARLILTLSEGRITAQAEDYEEPLYRGTANEASWDMIVKAIASSCQDGSGAMVDHLKGATP